MNRPRTKGRSAFFWQGLLISLPVIFLAGVGVWALQQDRLSVEKQARDRAAKLAQSVIPFCESFLYPVKLSPGAVFINGDTMAFEVGSNNTLLTPAPVDWPPIPAVESLNLKRDLSNEKRRQWNAAEAAFSNRDWSNAADLYLAFLDGRRRPATNAILEDQHHGIGDSGLFRALALFHRGNAFEHLGDTNQAMEAYEDALVSVPSAAPIKTDAGIPVSHLAALKILDLADNDVEKLPEDWRTNLDEILQSIIVLQDNSVFEDALLSRLQALEPELGGKPAQKVELDSCLRQWTRDTEIRKRFEEAADSRAFDVSPWPDAFWVQGDFRWLCLSQGTSWSDKGAVRGRYFAVFPESMLHEELNQILLQENNTADFAARLDAAGQKIQSIISPAADWQNEATSARAASTNLPVAITVALANPAEYFAAERRRRRPFIALLLAAAGTCVLGYLLARRAFYRQLRLNELKSDFVSSVSHELRAPIASVRLMAEGLERGKIQEPAKQHEYFKFIVQECRRLSSLIENVLDFSRIEEGRKRYEMESTDLVALAQQTVKVMETYAAERHIRIALTVTGTPAPVDLDGKAIQQALVNLIDNAIKHSPKGGEIAVGVNFNQASTIRVSVQDHGEGIAPAEQDKIFERFYRVGSELRRETQGVGIGLSIVKHIVEAHGGRITVHSAPGQGSRFTIELPAGNGKGVSERVDKRVSG